MYEKELWRVVMRPRINCSLNFTAFNFIILSSFGRWCLCWSWVLLLLLLWRCCCCCCHSFVIFASASDSISFYHRVIRISICVLRHWVKMHTRKHTSANRFVLFGLVRWKIKANSILFKIYNVSLMKMDYVDWLGCMGWLVVWCGDRRSTILLLLLLDITCSPS